MTCSLSHTRRACLAGSPDYGTLDATDAQERLLDAVWHIYSSNDGDCHPRGDTAKAFKYAPAVLTAVVGRCGPPASLAVRVPASPAAGAHTAVGFCTPAGSLACALCAHESHQYRLGACSRVAVREHC